jgi:uncharacterized protein YcbX
VPAIEIVTINVYPVKSLQPIRPDSWSVERRGLKHDRRWMVVDQVGIFMTRREVQAMAQIQAVPDGDRLVLSKEGLPGLSVSVKPLGPSAPVQVWRTRTTARYVSPEADAWLTKAIGKPCRLVYMPETARRRIHHEYNAGQDLVGFADAYPILVASEASIEDLNGRLDSPIPIQRFRPNLVIKGCGPFEEDTWTRLQIGEVTLRAARPCIRCLVTTQDPITGKLLGPEPLRTLATYRKVKNGVIFGMYYIPETLGCIALSDACTPS